MQFVDVQFDSGRGELEMDIELGVIIVNITESNPAFPTGANIKIPLDPIIEKIKAQDPSWLEKMGLSIVETVVDRL